MFATADDVATRLGRELTFDEAALAEAAIETVQGLILEIAGTAAPAATPAYYKALCVEKTIGALANPLNLASESESLGDYQHSATFPRSLDGGLFLSEREESTIRRIANGRVSGSVAAPAMPSQFVAEDA